MKNINKYIYVFIFFVSLFLFLDKVSADYQAYAVNPSGSTCNLYNGSTGYCYYKDSNLNSYVKGVIWLDTTDRVTVLTDYKTIDSPDKNLCSDYYVYTSFFYRNNMHYGYYCNANLKKIVEVSNELKEQFTSEGFPESYWQSLAILKDSHPNWIFKAVDTGLKFGDAVNGELKLGHSLLQLYNSNNYAYLSTSQYSFNYYENHFIERDSLGSSNPWCDANYEAIAYYLDPRNFLTDMYIFQFMGLAYDSSVDDETYIKLIGAVFNNDYLSKFANDFLTAAKESQMSPIYLSSLSRQEVGNGLEAGTAISGVYNGMYNFYNIGATGGDRPVIRGLEFAANTDPSTLRPWDTEYKAIVGGALWMKDMYIGMGQDTSYFKKFNVIYNYLKETGKVSNPYTNYNHEYMTNIAAPSSEAIPTYKSYSTYGLLDSGFIFYIPVFNNMPDSTSLPTKGGWPNNYLSSISINDNNIAEFDGGVETYNYYLDINTNKIKIDSIPVSDKATVEGNGEFEIESDTTKTIKVTAENGNIKEYNINIILTGTKLEDPIDVVKTLNNAGIKNGDKYISGITLGIDISVLKNKILSANNTALVLLKNSSGEEKNKGKVATGDKVEITVGDETKSYDAVIYGDANGDSEIDAIDYVRIRKYIMNTATLTNAYYEAADVNKDGNVDAIDYVRIRKYIMNAATIDQ